MNAIGRIEAPEDAAVPVPTERLEELYAGTVSYQAANARKWRRRGVIGLTFGAAATVTMFAQAWAIVEMLPLVRVVPVFVTYNADGSHETDFTVSSLPPDKRVAAIIGSLWQYVQHRERWVYGDSKADYDIVSGMSAPNVRSQYQHWINSKSPENPALKYGKDIYETVLPIGPGSWVEHSPDYTTGTYNFTFDQEVFAPDASVPATRRMTVTVKYVMADSIPMMERLYTNNEGVIVTEYPGAQPAGRP